MKNLRVITINFKNAHKKGWVSLVFFIWSILITVLIPSLISSAHAGAISQSFTYQGRFYNAAGTAPLADVVDLTLDIYDPNDTCLLYEEVQTNIDLTGTNGLFAVQVGTVLGDAKRSANDPGLAMTTVFANTAAQIRGNNSVTCPGGYTPSAADIRYLRVTVTPHSSSVPSTLTPDQVIGSNSASLVAQTLQGLDSTGFIQSASGVSNQANVSLSTLKTLTNGGDASSLHNHDSLYLKISSGGGSTYLGTGVTYTTGQLGIGVAVPTSDIGLGGSIPRTIGVERNTSTGNSGNSLALTAGGAASNSANQSGGALILSSGTSTGVGGSSIQFNTASSGSSGTSDNSPTSKMILTSDGRLGLGTQTPSAQFELDVGNASLTGQVIKGYSAQSSNLLELRNNLNLTLTYFDSNGYLTLAGSPSTALQAATKAYVDSQLTGGGGGGSSVPLAGGTMSGLLVLSADPGAALGAATKQYVDTGLSTKQNTLGFTPANRAGDTFTGNLKLTSMTTLGLGSYSDANESTLLIGTLSASDIGKTWYNSTSNTIKFWNGSAAQSLGISGAGLQNLNGQNGTSQTFANGTSGTAPSFTSSSNIHTLNIPMASGGGVTAGLLSNADYTTFSGKQASGNYITALTGDVTAAGPNSAIATVSSVGGSTATLVHSAELAANAATNGNTGSAIVKRDPSGNFTAGTVSAALTGNVTGNLTGNVTGNVSGTAASASSITGNLTGDVTSTGMVTTLAAATITGKALTGFASTTGAVTATDSILSAMSKLFGNNALNAPLASPTFTGTLSAANISSSGTVSATTFVGTFAGASSSNVLKAGDSMTGLLNLTTAGTSLITSGNVGIGTTSPLGGLDVNSSLGASSWSYFRGNLNGAVNPSSSATSGLMFGWNYSAGNGESLILHSTGAGSSPSLQFGRWNGTTKSIDMVLDSTGNMTVNNNLTVSGTFSSTSGGGFSGTTSGSNTNGTLNVTNSASSPVLATFLAGSLSPSNSTYFTLGKDSSGFGTGAMYYNYVASGSSSNSVSLGFYNSSLVVQGTGNVGIGTTTPGYALDVVGNIHTSGTIFGTISGSVTTATSITGNLTGDVTSSGMVTTLAAATVTGKPLTGFVSTTGTVTASDTILTAINKLFGNDALRAPASNPTFTGTLSAATISTSGTITAPGFSGPLTGNVTGNVTGSAATASSITGNLTGDVTSTGMVTTLAATTVTGKALTGFASTTGTVTTSDTILSAINKLFGNDALKAPIAGPTFTGTLSAANISSSGTVTATTFVGTFTGASSSNVLKAGDTMSGLLNLSSAGTSLTTTGNVGIGTTSPISLLSVSAPQAGLPVSGLVRIGGGYDYSGQTNNVVLSVAPGVVNFDGPGVAGGRMTISSAGNVGIGTTSPIATLDINGTAHLTKNASAPLTCDASTDGIVAVTNNYQFCICRNGMGWVFTTDGSSVCTWQRQSLFTSSGTFTVPTGITSVSAFVVGGGGGGGGGGSCQGGGGGGSGYAAYNSNIAVTPGAVITVTVGAGGSGSASYSGAYC